MDKQNLLRRIQGFLNKKDQIFCSKEHLENFVQITKEYVSLEDNLSLQQRKIRSLEQEIDRLKKESFRQLRIIESLEINNKNLNDCVASLKGEINEIL